MSAVTAPAPAPLAARSRPRWRRRSACSRGARSSAPLRQPATVFFALVFPLFLLAVNSGGLQAATLLPGFPTDDYLTFALALPCLQAGLFAVGSAGTDLATDIRTGLPRPPLADAR